MTISQGGVNEQQSSNDLFSASSLGSNLELAPNTFNSLVVANAAPVPKLPGNIVQFPPSSVPSNPGISGGGASNVSPLHGTTPALKVLQGGKSITAASPGTAGAAGVLSKTLPLIVPAAIAGLSIVIVAEVEGASEKIATNRFDALTNEALQGRLYSPEVIQSYISEANEKGVDTSAFREFMDQEYAAYFAALEVHNVSEQVIAGDYVDDTLGGREKTDAIVSYLEQLRDHSLAHEDAGLFSHMDASSIDDLIDYQLTKQIKSEIDTIGGLVQDRPLTTAELEVLSSVVDEASSRELFSEGELNGFVERISAWQAHWDAPNVDGNEATPLGWTYIPDEVDPVDIQKSGEDGRESGDPKQNDETIVAAKDDLSESEKAIFEGEQDYDSTDDWDEALENNTQVDKVRARIYSTDNLIIRSDEFTPEHLGALNRFSELGVGAEVKGSNLKQVGDNYIGIVGTEKIPGADLEKRLIVAGIGSEELDREAWGDSVVDILTTVHNDGVLHNDVKADQFLGDGDNVKIIDLESVQTLDISTAEGKKEFRNELGRMVELLLEIHDDDEDAVEQDLNRYLEGLNPALQDFASQELTEPYELLEDLQ